MSHYNGCGCGGHKHNSCNSCTSHNEIQQAVNDALAFEKENLEQYENNTAQSATDAAKEAAKAAESASAAAQSQTNAETAAGTATQAASSVTNTAVVLEETAERIEQAQDLLEEQISALQTKPVYFEVSTPISSLVLPETETVFNVRSIYVASARQDVGYGFTFDKATRTITLAEGITAEAIAETEEGFILITAICDVYSSDDPTSFPLILASNAGANNVGTSTGDTVETRLSTLDSKVDPTLRQNLGSSELPGAVLVSLEHGTVADALKWVTPQVFSSLEACFQSGVEDILIPAGTYIITEKMRVDITHNLNIVCQPGAVFKLADNVRQNMLVFVGNGTNNFSWKGGEIDGNWEGQGGETLGASGNIQDVSHGLIVSMFNHAEISDLYIHDCMGHHINHGGNWMFHAHDIRIEAHPSALKPDEGARGDGITGCSRNILIENIYGFTTDDFVGIFAGINWIEGIGSDASGYHEIDTVTLRNLNPSARTIGGVTYYSWTGCSIRPCYGKTILSVDIDGIKGDTRAAGARLHTATVSASGGVPTSEYYGNFGDINIKNIDIQVHGKPSDSYTNKLSNAAVQIGATNPNVFSATGSYLQTAKSVSIENVRAQIGNYSLSAVTVGHIQCDRVLIDGVSLTYDAPTLYADAILLVGQNSIRELTASNIRQQMNDSADASILAQRRVINTFYGGDIITLRGENLSRFVDSADSSLVPNVLTNNNATYGYSASKLLIASYDYVLSAAAAFGGIAFSRSMRMSVAKIGRYSVSSNGVKLLDDYVSNWDTTDFGRPSASNFPGYAYMAWTEGTVIRVKGSTHHDCLGWVCRSSSPTWQLLSTQVADTYGEITPTWEPTSATPGVEFITYATSGAWPVAGGGVVRTSVSTNSSVGIRAVQEFIPRSFLAKYTRIYQAGAWTAWKSTPYS